MTKKILLVLAAALLLVNAAWATHPNITASAVCDSSGNAVINFTSTAWDTTNPSAQNSDIDILFNGTLVYSGAYNAPEYSFSGSAPAPVGASSVIVTAYAAGLWQGIWPGGQSASVTVTVPTDCGGLAYGRFTGGGTQIRVGVGRINRGLTIHCDLLLSNNLEVNWPGGNNFHMTEHLETIECSDSPDIIQFPPAAPLDTLIGVGTGLFNGVAGYTIEFTLVDAGEPGSADQAAIKIYETLNPSNVVLNIPLQVLDTGNLQAHYDQPHK